MRKGHAVTGDDKPLWWHRLNIVRQRHPELADRELARRCALSHTTVSNIFSGIPISPQRKTIAQLVFTLTDAPNEREAVLSAFDQLTQEREQAGFDAAHPGTRQAPTAAFDPRSDTQILAEAINALASAITQLTNAIDAHEGGFQ